MAPTDPQRELVKLGSLAYQISSFELRLDENSMKKRSVHKVHEHFEEVFHKKVPTNGRAYLEG